jgi:hypothetical protein
MGDNHALSICFMVGSNGTIGVGKLHLQHLL